MSRRLVVSAVLLVACAARSEPIPFHDARSCGAFTPLEPGFRIEVRSDLGAPPAAVVNALTDWPSLGAILPMTKALHVEEVREDGARLYREVETPFFLPDAWVRLDARVRRAGDKTVIHLTRLDGTPKRLDLTFVVEPMGEGTRLTYVGELEPPFDPPSFLVRRSQRRATAELLAAVAEKAGAKTVTAATPCPPS